MAILWRYKSAPGEAGDAPARWPADSAIRHAPGRATVVMIAHPRCSCTRASLEELNILMQEARDVDGYVVVVRPDGVDDSFTDTGLQTRARAIPHVRVFVDAGGVEAARFGARVSGHTVAYDAAGALAFSGGITGARGHVGANLGETRLARLLAGERTDKHVSPVFGCPLDSPSP
jgi:hypothetical protein